MRLFLFGALSVAALAVSPVGARDKKPVDPNKKICRQEQVTGSIMGKSVCHTAADWAAIDEQNNRNTGAVSDQFRHGLSMTSSGG